MLDIYLLQRATTILDEVITNYGLCIIVSKTKIMILNHILIEDEYSDTIISLRYVPFQNSTEFKYIGSFMSKFCIVLSAANSRTHARIGCGSIRKIRCCVSQSFKENDKRLIEAYWT